MKAKGIAKIVQRHIGGRKLGRQLESVMCCTQESTSQKLPPVFVVGLPRSGSTLLYQLITSGMDVCYFSNLASVFYSYPALIDKCISPLQGKAPGTNYSSAYGVVSGLFGPSEAGSSYRYWFEKSDLSGLTEFRQTVERYHCHNKLPLVWKNLNLSLHIETLSDLFPNAIFVHIRRDLRFVCQSLFFAEVSGAKVNVNGVTLKGVDSNEGRIAEISAQLVAADDRIKGQLLGHEKNTVEVNYHDLINYPDSVLDLVVKTSGHRVQRRKNFLPPRFATSDKVRLDAALWDLVERGVGLQ